MRFREQYVMSVEQHLHHSTLYMYFPTKESYIYQRDLTNRVIIKSLAQIEFRIAALDQLTSHIEKQKQKRCLSVVTEGRGNHSKCKLPKLTLSQGCLMQMGN